jgi:hypothetical protein
MRSTLLVPGNRFSAAYEWLSERVPVLPRPDGTGTVFDFDFWSAEACYFLDPASNIVELIAHRGVGESPVASAFSAAEMAGISEIGIVTVDPPGVARQLKASGLDLWFGELGGPDGGLGFVGRRAHTLILCRPGRPWLPIGRPAETHPLEAVIGAGDGSKIIVRLDADSALDLSTR